LKRVKFIKVTGGKVKIIDYIARGIFVLCLPALFLSASIAICFNSTWLYQYGFNKYRVGYTTGLDKVELGKTARALVHYWNSGEEYINLTVIKDGKPFVLFNQREVLHLKDVKGLVRLDYVILLLTFIYVLAYAVLSLYLSHGRYRNKLAWNVMAGSGITLLLILALGIGSALDFQSLFLEFHLLSFANDFWQLNPATDYLIMLFPEGFWFDVVVFGILMTGGFAVITGGVTGSIYFFNKVRADMREGENKSI
jgi:integral membrane protein (TIGR01906 family)